MRYLVNLPALILLVTALVGCGTQDGFADLDRFVKEVDAKPRGKVEPLPEVQVYRAFSYSAANMRSPFLPPVEVVVTEVKIVEQSDVKPDEDRLKEVLESFSLSQLRMVGTIQKTPQDPLLALISDSAGGIHMVKEQQYMGKNHGRVISIAEGRLDLIEIVPNGRGGWLEKPRTISLADE